MIRFVEPNIHNLHFRSELLNDEDTMSYNHAYGGTIEFTYDKYEEWLNKWNNSNNRYYRLIFDDEIFVGEEAYYSDNGRYLVSIIIYSKYRNKGYGTAVLNNIIETAKRNNIKELYDDIAADNSSINLFLNNGFEIIEKSKDIIRVRKELL